MQLTMKGLLSRVTGVPSRSREIFPTATLTLLPFERHVRASTTGAAITITLPKAQDCEQGDLFYIHMVARSATDDITVVGEALGNIVLNLALEDTIILCTGVEFRELAGNHS